MSEEAGYEEQFLPRILGLIILISLVSCVQVVAQERAVEKSPVTAGEWQQLRERIARIARELTGLKDPEWAGVYQSGRLVGSVLHIAPESGFVYQPYTDVSDNDITDHFDYGEVKIVEGTLYVRASRGNFASGELFFARWGHRRFLLQPDDIPRFINVINAGCDQFQKEENVVRSYFHVRRDDRNAEVFGVPILPAQFRRLVLKTPITASVTSVGKTTVENYFPLDTTYPWRWRKTRLNINAGQVEGLWTGMALFVTDAAGQANHAVVKDIGEHSAEVEVSMSVNIGKKAPSLPAVGWSLTSRLKESQFDSFCW